MSPKATEAFLLASQKREHLDYLLDMLDQLAELARKIDEREVALHLEATTEARRLSLERRR